MAECPVGCPCGGRRAPHLTGHLPRVLGGKGRDYKDPPRVIPGGRRRRPRAKRENTAVQGPRETTAVHGPTEDRAA